VYPVGSIQLLKIIKKQRGGFQMTIMESVTCFSKNQIVLDVTQIFLIFV